MSQKDDLGDMKPPWRANQPFYGLPPLPPAAEIESRPVLKRLVSARAALAELKQAAQLLPNAGMLINTLPILEAQASSEIENIVTSTDALFRHLNAEKNADPSTREALRYRAALLNGFGSLASRPLTTRTAEQICSEIKGVEMTVRRIPGTVIVNSTTGAAVYTPPDGEDRLREMLANWEWFLHETPGLDPLVRMSVGHYQFEAIHPFTDGNGRTGRVLNSLYLVEQGLLPSPILYLSRYIIANKAEYYRRLLRVTTDGDWHPWILYMLEGVEQTAIWTAGKIDGIRRLADHTARYVRQRLPRIYRRELIDILFEQPYSRIGNLVEAGLVERQAASRHLQALSGIGVLREEPLGREKLFVHPKLLTLLTRDDHSFRPYD